MTRSSRVRSAAAAAAGVLLCLPLGAAAATSASAAATAPRAAAALAPASRLPAPPRVTVTVDGDGDLRLPASLPAGRYRFVVRSDDSGDVQLAKAARGYSKAQFARDFTSSSDEAGKRLQRSVRFYGGADAFDGHDGVFYETLYAGEYWAFSLFGTGRMRASDVHSLRVSGTPRSRAFPSVDGTVQVDGRGLSAPATLPRRGTLLLRNSGRKDRLLVLWELAPGKTAGDAKAWLRDFEGDLPFGDGFTEAGLLSGGLQVLRSYDLPAGRYALVDLAGARLVRGVVLR